MPELPQLWSSEGNQLLASLLALLPGLLTAEVVQALVVREKRTPFERIIQALLYTFLVHVTWNLFHAFIPIPDLFGLAGCAVAWGVILAWIINQGYLHHFFRLMRITKRGSRPNEWYDAFYRTQEYLVVHLKDGRRVFGWPLLWPERATEGHLFLTDANWLDSEQEPRNLSILISTENIELVEFVARTSRGGNDVKEGK